MTLDIKKERAEQIERMKQLIKRVRESIKDSVKLCKESTPIIKKLKQAALKQSKKIRNQ